MLRVVVLAAELRGHEPQYVQHVGEAIASLPGVRLTLVLPESARSFRDNTELRRLDSFGAELDFQTPPLPGRGFQNAAGRLQSLKKAIGRHRPDFVFIPTGDLLMQATTAWTILPFTRPRGFPLIDGIVHGSRFAYDVGRSLRSVKNSVSLTLLAQAPTERIKLLNFQAIAHLARAAPLLARRFELIPHPVDVHPPTSKSAARKALGIPEHGKVVGCVGVLDERKGMDLLLRAFASLSERPDARLLLVGRMSASLERLITEDYATLVRHDRLLIRNQFVTGAEMATAISAMDLVCTPYRAPYGIGSVILNANSLQRPVLSSAVGWPLMAVRSFGLGTTCDVHDAQQFADALAQSLDGASEFVPSAASRKLAAYHEPSNFAAHITRKPREMLGLPLSSDLLPWHTVFPLGSHGHGPG